jgi:integrase
VPADQGPPSDEVLAALVASLRQELAEAPDALEETVQARLRHASAKTTLDTYGHIWPDRDEFTRTAVAAVIAARPEQWRNSGEQPTRRRRSGPV